MRIGVILIVAAVLGCLFLVQKRHEHAAPPAATPVTAQKAATPRPVSEHNWAKHALDTTNKVTRQVAKERKENEVPK
jgi:hypothetical protein